MQIDWKMRSCLGCLDQLVRLLLGRGSRVHACSTNRKLERPHLIKIQLVQRTHFERKIPKAKHRNMTLHASLLRAQPAQTYSAVLSCYIAFDIFEKEFHLLKTSTPHSGSVTMSCWYKAHFVQYMSTIPTKWTMYQQGNILFTESPIDG